MAEADGDNELDREAPNESEGVGPGVTEGVLDSENSCVRLGVELLEMVGETEGVGVLLGVSEGVRELLGEGGSRHNANAELLQPQPQPCWQQMPEPPRLQEAELQVPSAHRVQQLCWQPSSAHVAPRAICSNARSTNKYTIMICAAREERGAGQV